ncbi:hypothetical protein BWP39_20885 [Paraburkholderia acidicola]|uniref:Uncharacterized protein n=1 Tax=Paraburkholderia acidicola TaxID=1912599 RepID=A0A2A4EM20_9BURK|nr:hypothetical protein BWP39_20885 [Paraburkholderia acidicola]
MKRFLALVFFAAVGLAAGWLASGLFLAFSPRCGYECENRAFGIFFLATVGGAFGFVLAGHLATRKRRVTAGTVLVVSTVLCLLMLLPAGGLYVWKLHGHYDEAEAARPVKPNLAFLHMTIATRAVRGYTDSDSGPVEPMRTIPQWQRCLIGTAQCKKQPRQAQMLCKDGVVYVNEADWRAFSLIPSENLPGTIALHSMNLCASQ